MQINKWYAHHYVFTNPVSLVRGSFSLFPLFVHPPFLSRCAITFYIDVLAHGSVKCHLSLLPFPFLVLTNRYSPRSPMIFNHSALPLTLTRALGGERPCRALLVNISASVF